MNPTTKDFFLIIFAVIMASCSALPIAYNLSVQQREVPVYISKNQTYKNLKLFFKETPPEIAIKKPSSKLVYKMPTGGKDLLVSSMSGTTISATPYSSLFYDEVQDLSFRANQLFTDLSQPRTAITSQEIFKEA